MRSVPPGISVHFLTIREFCKELLSLLTVLSILWSQRTTSLFNDILKLSRLDRPRKHDWLKITTATQFLSTFSYSFSAPFVCHRCSQSFVSVLFSLLPPMKCKSFSISPIARITMFLATSFTSYYCGAPHLIKHPKGLTSHLITCHQANYCPAEPREPCMQALVSLKGFSSVRSNWAAGFFMLPFQPNRICALREGELHKGQTPSECFHTSGIGTEKSKGGKLKWSRWSCCRL